MPDRKTVMISSTARDLPEHRQAVMDACLRQGMFPLMMEHLPASDADAIEVSLKMVEEADLYLGIYAHRYGYVPEGHDISITEMGYDRATELGLRPRARFVSMSVVGSDPILMLDGPIAATRKALTRAGIRAGDLSVVEVNEAFAPVPLAWQAEFDVPDGRLNPRGGAIALGHPLGASGQRLMTTMLHYLEDTGGRYGLQTMCEGGGMANATVIEIL